MVKSDKYPRSTPAQRQQQRDAYLKYDKRLRKHKITRAEWDAQLNLQGGRCKLCSRITDLVVDHDHTVEPGKPGYMRGILCRQHNVGLGMFRDSEAELLLALNYLRGQ